MASDIDIREMLTLQISEMEMLQSMFPNTGELCLDDPLCVADIQSYVQGECQYENLCSRIGFNLKMDCPKGSLEMVCHLPHEYPAVCPQVFMRSGSLSRTQHRLLTDHVQQYIQSVDRGDICMYSVIEWLQDNADSYMQGTVDAETKRGKCPPVLDTTFTRMWVYSHHIYSKIKRKDILNFSSELKLSGFCMPGKPGIICLEGYSDNVEEFWQRIRRMQWKRLVMKEKEDTVIEAEKSVDSYRKFVGFEEKYFEPRQGKGRGAHMDRGLLYQFLEQKGCGHIFPVYFGVEGKVADDSD